MVLQAFFTKIKDGIINTYMYSMLFKIYSQDLFMCRYFLITVEWYLVLTKMILVLR